MSFYEIARQIDFDALRQRLAACGPGDVERALAADQPDEDGLIALFSAAAVPYLETLAQRSAALTERRFGRVIQLYAPLYLSNECVNKCTYCGFSHELDIPRVTLTPDQVLADAEILYNEGFRHVLLVSGEDRRYVNLPYLLEIVDALRERFASISIEIQPLPRPEYEQLAAAGVDGLVMYQEVYDPLRYGCYHLAGPKRSYNKRLEYLEGGGEAGFRSLGIGSLLGLSDWRPEAVVLALHGRYLTRRFWRSRVAVSFPRIRSNAHQYDPDYRVGDRDLVQMLCGMRLALPDAELIVSTREPARLRDRLIGLGVTRMSAGSRTNPGGYSRPEDSGEQFDIEDTRSPAEVAAVIDRCGFEPVWKDFDREFIREPVVHAGREE